MAEKKTTKPTAKKPAAKKTTDKKAAPKKAATGADKKPDAVEAGGASGLPMFYNGVTLLNKETHGKLKVKPLSDHGFAANANSIVLAASEFAQAAAHYPIVFGKAGDEMMAFAVTGHTGGENAFLDDKKRWRSDTYIPAYVRRYPFLLVQSQDGQTFSLAVDESSQMLNTKSGELLYEKGEATETARRALGFCVQFRQELERSKVLLKQLDDSGILVERTANVELPNGKKSVVTGFSIVDEKLLAELDDDKFLELRKTGLLNLIYCHLWSMRVWNNLLA